MLQRDVTSRRKRAATASLFQQLLSSLSFAVTTGRHLRPTKNIYAVASAAAAGTIPNVLQYQCVTENNARSSNTRNEREFASFCQLESKHGRE